jgi:hypothetical protein
MQFEEVEKKAMRTWLGKSTCFSGHVDDKSRFHAFVATLWKTRQKQLSWDYEVYDLIRAVYLEEYKQEPPEKILRFYLNQASTIFGFLENLMDTGRLYLLADE